MEISLGQYGFARYRWPVYRFECRRRLGFALENDMVDLGTMKERVQSWAERLDLMKLLDHRPQDLSGGQNSE